MTPAELFRRLRGTVRTDRFEEQMDAELRFHLELETEELIRRGMSPADARATAARGFGSVAHVKDECRDSWGVRALDTCWQDLRYAARNLRQYPSYTAVVLMTLALGIGANTAIFSVVHAVLLRSLPYAAGDRLIEIRQQQPKLGNDHIALSRTEMNDYRDGAPSLEALVEYHQMGFSLLGHGDATRVQTGVVSHDFFDVIGVTPILGRSFRIEDEQKDAPAVLILSYSYWARSFGSDPHIIGRVFEMNDRAHTVVGVLPDVPQYPDNNDVYMPVSACPFRSAPMMATDRRARMVSAIARLKPGVPLARAQQELSVVAARMVSTYPDAYPAGTDVTVTALSVKDELTRSVRPTLLVLLATTGLVLLLVCANVANLTLARLVGRERELAVRAALGAGRRRIARQLLTESTLLAVAGGALGLLLAAATRSLLVNFTARFTPRAAEIGIDGTVLLFAVTVSVVTGIVFGLAPAFPRRTYLSPGLHDGPRTVTAPGLGARHALIVAQVAISFVLLIAAGLMVRSFINLQNVDAGFNADHVVTMKVSLDFVKYDTNAARRAFYRRLLDQITNTPGIRAAALSLAFPLDETLPSWFNTTFVLEGRPLLHGQVGPRADFRAASPQYFKTLGIALLEGREFTDADNERAPLVAIVNLSFARHHFAGVDPIGRRVSIDGGRKWIRIVGLVNDVRQYGLAAPPADELYLPFAARAPLGATVLVRTAADPMASVKSVQAIARAIDPRQPISQIETLADVRSSALASPRLTTILVTLFAVVALVITAAGIGGVVSFSVTQRTTEIGVRMALGAPKSTVIRMIVRQGLTPVAFGLALGVAGAFVATRLVGTLLFAVEPTDPPTFGIVLAVLAAVAAIACLAPARRAAAIDPMHALRAN